MKNEKIDFFFRNKSIDSKKKEKEKEKENTMGNNVSTTNLLAIWHYVTGKKAATNNPYIPDPIPTGDAIYDLAAVLHRDWRILYEADPKTEGDRREDGKKIRMKDYKNAEGMVIGKVNINDTFDKIKHTWREENLAAAKAALQAVRLFPHFWESDRAAAFVHDEWMTRTVKQDYNAHQFKPFHELSKLDKEKDRVHVRTAKQFLKNRKPINYLQNKYM